MKINENDNKEDISLISKIFFLWMNPILCKGNENPLNFDDLPELPYFNKYYRNDKKCKNTKNKFNENWNKQLRKEKYIYNLFSPSIISALWSSFKKEYLISFTMKLLIDLLVFANPISLNLILNFLKDDNKSIWYGIMLCLLLFLFTLFRCIVGNQNGFMFFKINMLMRSALTTAIYDKTLRISMKSRNEYTSGEINNLMSVDSIIYYYY